MPYTSTGTPSSGLRRPRRGRRDPINVGWRSAGGHCVDENGDKRAGSVGWVDRRTGAYTYAL